MNDFHPDADWHAPEAPRTLILACLGSAFVVACMMGAAMKWGWLA